MDDRESKLPEGETAGDDDRDNDENGGDDADEELAGEYLATSSSE